MLYNKPYGAAGADDPYINGDPSIGRAGSIPPAAAIEYPQREVANFITITGQTPTNSDLNQLSKSVQTQKVNWAIDVGSANLYAVTLAPVPTSIVSGMVVRMKVAHAPTGPSTLNVNGLGAVAIKKRNGAAIQAFEFFVNDVVELVHDGTSWQLLGSQTTPLLGAALDYYVNANTGSDSNSGLTAGSPFLTIQKAVDTTQTFNLNGYTVTIHVADYVGTYAKFALGQLNGSGSVFIIGNTSTPASVHVHAATGPGCYCSGAGWTVRGMMFSSAAIDSAAALPAAGVEAGPGGVLGVDTCEFSTCVDYHMIAYGGTLAFYGAVKISGNAAVHVYGANGGKLFATGVPLPTLTVTLAMVIGTAFANSVQASVVQPIYTSITNPGNVTGTRYIASTNGIINTGGGGANYLPGTVAGSVSTGGQYT